MADEGLITAATTHDATQQLVVGDHRGNTYAAMYPTAASIGGSSNGNGAADSSWATLLRKGSAACAKAAADEDDGSDDGAGLPDFLR